MMLHHKRSIWRPWSEQLQQWRLRGSWRMELSMKSLKMRPNIPCLPETGSAVKGLDWVSVNFPPLSQSLPVFLLSQAQPSPSFRCLRS